MDGPIGRKRRAKALGSKKDIILSRSLGAGSSKERKEVTEGLTKSAPIVAYTDQDRKRDEDILDRFDRDFGLDCNPVNAVVVEADEKNPQGETTVKEKQQLADKKIDRRSTSSINLSKMSSSGIHVSAHNISSPTRRRIKNTIQCLSFERYLASIDSKFPPMNEQDRILFWKCCPDPNGEVNYPDKTTDDSESSITAISVLENNNEKICFPNKHSDDSKYSDIKNMLVTLNTPASDRIPPYPVGQNMNSAESKENFSTLRTYSRREPLRRVYGNARQVKQSNNQKETSELATFKVPDNPEIPSNIVKSAANTMEMTATQKEEFYKYLGLETASPNKHTERTNIKKNYKRRSLRVRQMRILQDTKRKARKIKNVDRSIKKEKIENTIDRSLIEATALEVIDETANLRMLNGAHSQDVPESIRSEQRRTCGSIVECKSYGSPKANNSKRLEIIERIDYSKGKEVNNGANITPCNSQKETARCFEFKSTYNAGTDVKPNSAVKYNTRMRRKNGFIIKELNKENLAKLKKSTDHATSSDLSVLNKVDTRVQQTIDIIEVGRKCQQKHKLEKIPELISCVESIAYVKSNNTNKMSNIQTLDQSINHIETSASQLAISTEPILISETDDDELIEKISLQSDFNGFEMNSIDKLLLSSGRSESNTDNIQKGQVGDHESGIRTISGKHTIISTRTECTLKSIRGCTTRVPRKQSISFEKAVSVKSMKTTFDGTNSIGINLNEDLRSHSQYSDISCTNSIELMEVETPKILHQSSPKPKLSSNSTAPKRKSRMPVIKRRRNRKLRVSRHHKIKPKLKNKKTPSFNVTSTTYGFLISAPDSVEKMETTNVETVAESAYSAYPNLRNIESMRDINVNEFTTEAFLPNPLNKSNGIVLHGFYEQDFLIIVQTQKISFWKYVKILKMLGVAQDWELLGEHERLCTDLEIVSPYKNRLCMNEQNPVYIEMRAKQFADDTYRECNLASVYVNVYYYDEWKATVVVHSVQLDTIRCVYTDIIFTTIINSRYFIMCWKQESFTNIIRTGMCKYALTPSLNMLASIREFKTRRHTICKLQCLSDDRLIGLGETHVTIWEHTTGDILVDFDFGTAIGYTLESLYCSEGFQEYLFLYQHQMTTTSERSKLVVSAVRLKDRPLEFKNVFQHELPSNFSSIQSSLAVNNMLIVTSQDSSELLLHVEEPQKLFFSTILQSYCASRFYTTGSQYFVQLSDKYLIVKTIPELSLDFM